MFQHDRLLLVFRYRSYRWFFCGHLLSWIGNSMQVIANSWLALVLTGSPTSVASVFVATTLPGLLCAPFIGVLVDRFDRRWISTINDAVQALLLFLLFVIGASGHLQVWHIYVLAFFLALGEVIYRPSSIALLREEVPVDALVYTNSYNGIARQAGGAVGAALAGVLIVVLSPSLVFLVNGLSFVCSALCTFKMRRGYRSPVQALTLSGVGRQPRVRRLVRDLTDGWKYISGRRDIILFYAIFVIILSTLNVINVAIAIFVKNDLHASVSVMGAMEAAFAVGSVAGNLIITAIAGARGTYRTMAVGVWAVVLTLLMLAFSFNPPFAIVSYFLLGGTLPVWLLYLTSVQKIVPDQFQGRVNATFQFCSAIISLLAFVIMGYLLSALDVRVLYFIQVGLLFLPGVLAYRYIFGRQQEGKSVPVEAADVTSSHSPG
jgi:MFS family permease